MAQLWGAPARVQLALSLGRSRAEAGGERRPPSGFPVSGRQRGELRPGSLAATFSSVSQAGEISSVFRKARTCFPLGQCGLDGPRLSKSDG